MKAHPTPKPLPADAPAAGLAPNTAHVWSATPFDPLPGLSPMVLAEPNADGSYAGYNTSTAARQLRERGPGFRVLLFQRLLAGLFDTPGDVPPFYTRGIEAARANVAVAAKALRKAGVKALDAVIPDAEGALELWRVTPEVMREILDQPQGEAILGDVGYEGPRGYLPFANWLRAHPALAIPALLRYADAAILAATQPLRDLYGDVVIQKWSLAVPDFAARVAEMPWDNGDVPGVAFASSFTQTEELYGGCDPRYVSDASEDGAAEGMADRVLTRVAAAAATCPKPVVPWVAPRSWQGGWPIPWRDTPEYDRLLAGICAMTGGRLLYWRPPGATAADDEAVAGAVRASA